VIEAGMFAFQKEDMSLANLRLIKNTKTTEARARAVVKAQSATFYRLITWPTAICNGSYLDVDEILARSLPEVVSAQVATVSEKSSRLGSKTFAAIPKTKIQGDSAAVSSAESRRAHSLEVQELTSE
jgi:hypothetical protein